MTFSLVLTEEAEANLAELEAQNPPKADKVKKALALMETNLRHPGLHTHEFRSLQGRSGEKVFEAYVENRTPAAYRIFWHYGPQTGQITILSITAHP